MSELSYCPHCLSTMPAGGAECPFCGHSMHNTNPHGMLAYGTVLGGRYTLGEFISADGEGVLYQAVDTVPEPPVRVTVKEYLPVTLAEDRDEAGSLRSKQGSEVLYKTTRMDFVDLYRELMKITPATGLETVLDVFEENNTAYAVMENPGGVPLAEYLAEQPGHIPPAEARSMLLPVFEGVAAMHEAGLVHRGVSPDNIRVLENGKARLSGYATLGLRTLGSAMHAQLYEGYSAPEQYSKAEFEGRYTDAYGLAAVFYRMVTGQAPTPAGQRRVADSNPTARSLDHTLPGWLSEVLDHALALRPADRIQTVPVLMSSLTSPAAAQAIRKEVKKDNQHKRNVRGLLAAILVGVCVLICLTMWSLTREGGPLGQPVATATPEPTATPTPEPKEYMPDFTGMTYSQLQASGQYAGHFRFYLTEEYSDTVAAGVIIRQDPVKNTEIREETDRMVTLVVSKGPEHVTLPNVIGFTQDSAVAELSARGLYASCVMQANDGSYVPGCVIKTSPSAGEEVLPGSTVHVYIAAEPHVEVNNDEQTAMLSLTP